MSLLQLLTRRRPSPTFPETSAVDRARRALAVLILLVTTGTDVDHLPAVLVLAETPTVMATARGARAVTTTTIVLGTDRLHAVDLLTTTRLLAAATKTHTVATTLLQILT